MASKAAVKMILVLINITALIFGGTLIVLSIYVTLDHGIMSQISGSYLYEAGAYMLFFAGLVVFLGALIGWQGSVRENRFLLIVYVAGSIIILIVFAIGGVLALVFNATMSQTAQDAMSTTLKSYYGRYRWVTDAWNLTQSKLRCCGVEDRGWSVYKDSYWDRWINGDRNDRNVKISESNPEYIFVPESCCWTLIYPLTGWATTQFRDQGRCQHWQFGPPNHPDGAQNDALYYRGCFNAAKDYLYYHAVIVGIIGLVAAAVLIIGVVCGIILLVKIPTSDKQQHQQQGGKNAYYEPADEDMDEKGEPINYDDDYTPYKEANE